jgi:hypothetical protein
MIVVKELKFRRIVLETDIVVVVAKLNKEQKDMSKHGPLIEEIKRDPRELEDYWVKWAWRTANRVAHF